MSWCVVVVVRRRSITDEAEANDAKGERADDEWGMEEAEEDRPGLDEAEEGEDDGEEALVSSKGASMAALSAKSFRLCTRRSIITVPGLSMSDYASKKGTVSFFCGSIGRLNRKNGN